MQKLKWRYAKAKNGDVQKLKWRYAKAQNGDMQKPKFITPAASSGICVFQTPIFVIQQDLN